MGSAVDWETDGAGNVVLNVVNGFDVGEVMKNSVVARIRYLGAEKDGRETAGAIQFVLNPTIALELAELLERNARHILNQRRPARPN
jgi:hypothetical protein